MTNDPAALIRELLEQSLERPLMHRSPAELEAWCLALLAAMEAVASGSTESRMWFDLWRAECAERGLGSAESLADQPGGQDWREGYVAVEQGLRSLLRRIDSTGTGE